MQKRVIARCEKRWLLFCVRAARSSWLRHPYIVLCSRALAFASRIFEQKRDWSRVKTYVKRVVHSGKAKCGGGELLSRHNTSVSNSKSLLPGDEVSSPRAGNRCTA